MRFEREEGIENNQEISQIEGVWYQVYLFFIKHANSKTNKPRNLDVYLEICIMVAEFFQILIKLCI